MDAEFFQMAKESGLMHIGELAQKSRLSVRAIHYYEEVGLISPSGRTVGGFRLYSDEHLEQLKLICELKALDMSLCKIKELICDQRTGLNDLNDSKLKPLVESQLRQTKSRIFQRINFIQELKGTIDILNECESRQCNKRPTKANCQCCEVVLDRDFLPLTFKAIYI